MPSTHAPWEPNVPATQLRTLRRLIRQIRQHRSAPHVPVIEIDLDLTAVRPVRRTRAALIAAGAHAGISEFLLPESLPVLPGYSDEAWLSFVRTLQLPVLYPQFQWILPGGSPNRAPGEPFAVFHRHFWAAELMADDEPTPGLGAFAHRVLEEGGEIVFISGRWLPEHVQPSLTVLERAGIPQPKLVIGNDRHETLVPPGQAISDAAVKALHQDRIVSTFGRPVAIVDDRAANRDAVCARLGGDVMSVAIAIPGFTHDAATDTVPWRLTTFETFDAVYGEPPHRPLMTARYAAAGAAGPWLGLYEGMGRNALPYAISRQPPRSGPVPEDAPFRDLISAHAPGSLDESDVIAFCEATIPAEDRLRLDRCLAAARELGAQGLAAPFPHAEHDERSLRHALLASWLHSRDVEHLMAALGFPLAAAGVHDLEEMVPGRDVRQAILPRGHAYSSWLVDWANTLDEDEPVNVSFLNPALVVSLWRWTPSSTRQDAMDVHRLAAHHAGDGAERHDPFECAVNNVLHQREGRCGIRKEPVVGWDELQRLTTWDTQAHELAHSSVGRQVVRDSIALGLTLEARGVITPWTLVRRSGST